MEQYKDIHAAYRRTCNEMLEALKKWVESKGGSIDAQGYVKGISESLLTHYEIRNEQLCNLLNFESCIEAERKRLEAENLKIEAKNKELLKLAQMPDSDLQQTALDLYRWEVEKETGIDEFRKVLLKTVIYLDAACKRHLIVRDAVIDRKIQHAVHFLQHEDEMKKFLWGKVAQKSNFKIKNEAA